MAHFTQLGLSANQQKQTEVKPQGKTPPNVSSQGLRPRPNEKQFDSKRKTAALFGWLIATALLGVFVLESGCSKESSKTAAIATPNQPVTTQPIQTMPASASTSAVASQPPAKKKARQRKLSASTYTNPAYGVSFRYPKYDNLKQADEANLEQDGAGPVAMNYVQSGGATIGMVELPRKLYSGTDFNSAFFNVSVNPKLTAAECEQFAFAGTDDPENNPAAASKTKVGATEFYAVEGFAEDENNEADVRYYHVFQNGSCYEFALGLETVAQGLPDESKPDVKPVNHNEVFRKLNWILSTVKIQPIVEKKNVPEVAADTPTVSPNSAITEAH
jgi:hypothetical protein